MDEPPSVQTHSRIYAAPRTDVSQNKASFSISQSILSYSIGQK
jgi:hypothetical protein